jgi:magnesium and cobalt transporter
VPKRNESITFDGFRFVVLRADSRKVHSLMVERLAFSATVAQDGALMAATKKS